MDKVRFAKNLGGHVVSIRDGVVIVHCVGWIDLLIDPKSGECAEVLRRRILELLKGTSCNVDDVQTYLEIALV